MVSLLIVEDNDDDWREFEQILEDTAEIAPFRLTWNRCKSLAQAHKALAETEVTVLILDLVLPDSSNPLETTKSAAKSADPLGVPIIVLSGIGDNMRVTRECWAAGAYQHLQKGRIDQVEVYRAIELSCARARNLAAARDAFLEAERRAAENLELAGEAVGALTRLRSDLRQFRKNQRNQRIMLSLLAGVVVTVIVPSVNAKSLQIALNESTMGVIGVCLLTIWGEGTFAERIRQGSDAVDLVNKVSQKRGDTKES